MAKTAAYSLWVIAVVVGMCCHGLIGQQNVPGAIVLISMFCAVFWFLHRDHEVDSYST